MMAPTSSPTAALLFFLLLSLTSDAKGEYLAIHDAKQKFHGPGGFHPPRRSDDLTGHGLRYFQRPHMSLQYLKEKSHGPILQESQDFHQESAADHLANLLNSLNVGTPSRRRPLRWSTLKGSLTRGMDNLLERSGVSRTLFYSSMDDWFTAFQSTLKRDAVYNVGKIGGLIILYYFFPGVLRWLNDTFGSF